MLSSEHSQLQRIPTIKNDFEARPKREKKLELHYFPKKITKFTQQIVSCPHLGR